MLRFRGAGPLTLLRPLVLRATDSGTSEAVRDGPFPGGMVDVDRRSRSPLRRCGRASAPSWVDHSWMALGVGIRQHSCERRSLRGGLACVVGPEGSSRHIAGLDVVVPGRPSRSALALRFASSLENQSCQRVACPASDSVVFALLFPQALVRKLSQGSAIADSGIIIWVERWAAHDWPAG